MNKTSYKEFAQKYIDYAKSAGADEIQINISDGSEFTVECRNQKLERLTEAGTRAMYIKVIVDHKTATASSQDFDDSTIKMMISSAIKRAEITSSDPFAGLPKFEDTPNNFQDLHLYDEAILGLSPEEKIKKAKEIEKIGLDDKRIKNSIGSYFSSAFKTTTMANSNGFIGEYPSTYCSAGLSLQAGDNDNFFEEGWYETARSISKLPSTDFIANKAIEQVTRLIGAQKVETQNVPVIFSPQMTAMLLNFFRECISGSAIYMNASYLVDKLNTKIASDIINIYDDPLISGAIGSRPFDSEGVYSRKNTIIENGILKTYLTDTYSAKKLNTKSTGSASGVSNFYLAAGQHSQDELIKSIKNGLYLTGTIGHGTNATSGDISKGAYGVWIENGTLSYPVAEITFSGNMLNIFNNIEMIANDLTFDSSIVGPSIKVKELTISGK